MSQLHTSQVYQCQVACLQILFSSACARSFSSHHLQYPSLLWGGAPWPVGRETQPHIVTGSPVAFRSPGYPGHSRRQFSSLYLPMRSQIGHTGARPQLRVHPSRSSMATVSTEHRCGRASARTSSRAMASNQKSVVAAATSGPRPASCSGTGCAPISRWMWRLRDLEATTPWNWPPRRGAHVIPMCVLHLLLITTSLSHLFTAASGAASQAEEARNFVQQRVNDAEALAASAAANWDIVWSLGPNCAGDWEAFSRNCEENCSLGECLLLNDDQLASLSCVHFDIKDNLTGCHHGVTTSDPFKCDAIHADYSRSFVSFPNSTVVTSTPSEVELSICAQKQLDTAFQNLKPFDNASASVNPYYSQMYFAGVDGSYRTYPARPPRQNCTSQKLFDARKRSWYMSAVSGVHELAIVLDSGYSMNDYQDVAYFSTRFEVAQSIIANVLETLVLGSSVFIISFNDLSSNYVSAIANDGDPQNTGTSSNLSDEKRNALLQFVQNSRSPSQAGRSSNISLGLEAAFNILGNKSLNADDPPKMKVIMVLTDGQSSMSAESMGTLSQRVKGENVTLFLYQLGPSKDISPVLDTLSNAVAGQVHVEAINGVVGNELYQIRSYFSFLAQCRARAAQWNSSQLAFWKNVYIDRDILGEVITISYPAMSKDFCELIGVIGIDIQVRPFYLRSDIQSVLPPNATKPFIFSPGIAYPCQNSTRSAAPPVLACFPKGPDTDIGGICGTSGQSNPQPAATSNALCCDLGTCPTTAPPPGPGTDGPEPSDPNGSGSQRSSAGKSKSISIIVGCVVGGVGALAIVIFLYVKCLREKCVEASIGTPPPRAPARPDQSPGPESSNFSSSSDTALKF